MNLRVADGADLAVSLYLPGSALAATEHALGLHTTYISPEGDYSGADTLPVATTTESFYFLTGVEVDAARGSRAIVTLGDSITDGLHSTADANRRWPDRLAERLRSRRSGGRVAVLNAGISGNRVLHDTVGTNASARLDRDVLVQSGARYLIVLEGINDIGFPGAATAEEIIAAHLQIIDRAHAMGLKVYGGTLTPFQAFLPGLYYTSDGEAMRQAVNRWIRTSKAYDAVIDFDKALRDPGNPATIRPAYDSGDNLHPNDAGYKAMADAIDLSLFAVRGHGAPCGRREKPDAADGQGEGDAVRAARPEPTKASRHTRRPLRLRVHVPLPWEDPGDPGCRCAVHPAAKALGRGRQYGSLALSFRIGASTRCHIAAASRTVSPNRAAKGGSSRISEERAESQSSSGHMNRWMRYRP